MRRLHRVGFKKSYLRSAFWRGNALVVLMAGVCFLLIAAILLVRLF